MTRIAFGHGPVDERRVLTIVGAAARVRGVRPQRGAPRPRSGRLFLEQIPNSFQTLMAWPEPMASSMRRRCSECGGELLPGVEQIDLGLGGVMHESCYDAWLQLVDRGVIGSSGENDDPAVIERRAVERTEFLDGVSIDEKKRQLAYERACTLFGREAAERSYGRKNHGG